MKRVLTLLVCLLMILALAACSTGTGTNTGTETKKTIYVTGPTPDHGWTAQAGTYAQQKVDEINAEGKYKAQYLPASSGEDQVDIANNIIANGDAAGVVFFALDDTAKAGQEALIANEIPFISFDRIIDGPDKYAILNFSGDNWQCGRAIAYWMLGNGMTKDDVLVTLYGDNGTVCTRRYDGFTEYLTGSESYTDKNDGDFTNDAPWTSEEADALTATYKTVVEPNWSADGAYSYLEQQLPDIIAKAKAANGRLYVFSMDDEMTFGFLNLINGGSLDDATKADLEGLEVYISAIGGMQELYDIMDGSSDLSAVADQYFDDMMSVYFSPRMMTTAIDYMLQYLAGTDWSYSIGDGEYEPVFIVDRENAADTEGFTGH